MTTVSMLGLLWPALLTAMTRNWYSVPSLRVFRVQVSSIRESVLTCVHRVANLSFISRMYPVIGLPPSRLGGVHVRVTVVGVTLDGSGASGAAGTSGDGEEKNKFLELRYYDYLSKFLGFKRNFSKTYKEITMLDDSDSAKVLKWYLQNTIVSLVPSWI